MTPNSHDRSPVATYGARPVSVDIARGRTLTHKAGDVADLPPAWGRPLTDQVIADRLALAHWPIGHQIVVCGLAGGTGRTTMAGLIATVLTELPYAHIWHPVGLIDDEPRGLSRTRERWDVVTDDDPEDPATCTRSGAWILPTPLSASQRRDFSVVVLDAPAGLPSDLDEVDADGHSSVVLMTRPDRASLSETAEALVWMNDHGLLSRSRVTTVINHGTGHADRGSRAAATALGIRSAAIHSLPTDQALSPGNRLPSGHDLPVKIRRRVAHLCLDIWSQTNSPIRTAALSSPYLQENR